MGLKQIRSSTVALLVAALLFLAVGTYTDNGGFRLAGELILAVGLLVAFSQAMKRND
ncbi:hypothetical protein [Pseudoxanthomonas sangjuensis]|uniref:hypothetical protein n=1 Tax=Pseudoxanthomonas sangjuensis TaxID=1503750 RepID=UPI001392050D|nr:hypothetical protein [Pseudoxanthomonas sangjuensis]